MTTNEHLYRILSKCREIIALGEKRTPGRWLSLSDSLIISPMHLMLRKDAGIQPNDANFIAACAGPAEAMARSTIAAIEALRAYADFAVTGTDARKYLDAIRAAWPEEIL